MFLFNFLRLVLKLLLLSHSVSANNSSTTTSMQQPCHDEERSALLQFKHSFAIDASASKFQGAYPKVSSWKAQGKRRNCCEWDGIECDEKTGHVIGADLSSSCLFGSINSNSTLFRLVHLQRLNLADNHFNFSRIPTTIGRLSMLTSLNLSASMFSGQIPDEVSGLSKLFSLDLSINYPDGFGERLLKLKHPNLISLIQNLSTRLEKLNLNSVDISSQVPDVLTNFSSLTSLQLENCGLSGVGIV